MMSQQEPLRLNYGDRYGGGVSLDGIIAGVASVARNRNYARSTANGGGVAYRSRAGFSVKAALGAAAALVLIPIAVACGGGGYSGTPASAPPAQAAATRQAPPLTESAAPAPVAPTQPAPTLAAPAPTLDAAVQATLVPIVPATVAPPPTAAPPTPAPTAPATAAPPTAAAPTAAPPPTRAPATPTPQPNVQIYDPPDNDPVYVKDGIILAGLKNTGNASANNVYAQLLVNGKEVYSWTTPKLKPNDVSFGAVSLATIVREHPLPPGPYNVTVAINGAFFTKILDLNFPELLTKPSDKPSVPVSLPDLVPYIPKDKGWGAPVVLLSEDGSVLGSATTYQPGRMVGVAFKNDSSVDVVPFSYSLFVDGKHAQSWSVSRLGPGEVAAATISLDEVVREQKLKSSDKHVFELVVDSDNDVPELNEGDANRFATSALEFKVAKDPVPRRAPQSPTEAKIQAAFDNFTWYTSANAPELVGIAKEVLKDVPIDWSRISVSVLPFDEFNESYDKAFGEARGPPTGLLGGYGFVKGQKVYLREGILPQVLPIFIREVGGAHYSTTNLSGARKTASLTDGPNELFQGFFTAYGVSVLIEDFGWAGLTNASYLVGTDISSFLSAGLPSLEIKSMWVAAFEEGYKNGHVPSDVWLRLYNQFIQMPDPTGYITALGRQAIEMDAAHVIEISKSRLVDKEPTLLPSEISRKLNPHNPREGISLDRIVLNQIEFFHPAPYSTN